MELNWPHLAQMAYYFHFIPAMSLECEQGFSSCGKMTNYPRGIKIIREDFIVSRMP
jgi:hypothetical protein